MHEGDRGPRPVSDDFPLPEPSGLSAEDWRNLAEILDLAWPDTAFGQERRAAYLEILRPFSANAATEAVVGLVREGGALRPSPWRIRTLAAAIEARSPEGPTACAATAPAQPVDAVALTTALMSGRAMSPAEREGLLSTGDPARKAAISLSLAIAGFVLLPLLPSILAAVLGGIALAEANRRPGRPDRGLAFAGLALGVAGTLFWSVLVAIVAVTGDPHPL